MYCFFFCFFTHQGPNSQLEYNVHIGLIHTRAVHWGAFDRPPAQICVSAHFKAGALE